jgi:protein O-mannosyl-transferase
MANPNWKLLLLRALLIVAAGFWVFAPALRGDWLMDDDMYLTQNALLNDPARLWKIWFAPGSLIEYYPIEASAQAIQWYLWHTDTLGYHLTNLILHVLGALLVWRLLSKFGLHLAWLGGFLFAIHPAVVESVAWISEFKNTLSLPLFLLSMCAWIDYEERGRSRDYFLALVLFFIAMLCKISMAPFPLVILLYAWWKRGRAGWNDLKASAPFFAVSLGLSAISISSGEWYLKTHLQSTTNPPIGDFLAHLVLAGWSISFYFTQCVWPVKMLPIYPKWPVDPHALISFLPWLILGGVFCWLWIRRANWGRHALLGLGFFLINLAPFIGLTSVSYMRFTWVMDHFLYLPMIGLIGLAIAALEQIEGRISGAMRPLLAGMTAVVLALLAWESHDYAGMFIGPEKLWTYTVERDPTAWLAYNNLGNVLFETGRVPEAIGQYEKALQLNPGMVEAHNNLGLALYQTGRVQEAIDHYQQALIGNPHFAIAHTNLGNAFSQMGRIQEAIDHYQQALLANPHDSAALANLAKLQAGQKTTPSGTR